ncbi:MAG: hypothetical protein KGZ32_02630 [Dethiobacter sp.]|jgi:hypothetical protein|nr:hypothetical protein [Dethiobacter sp.]
MRACFLSITALLLALIVLYCGLNLAERNLSDLMALEQEAAAFTVTRLEDGAVALTYSGQTITLCAARIKSLLESWWRRLPFFTSELFVYSGLSAQPFTALPVSGT